MAERPLSILHVFAPSPAGGLDRVVEGLASGQRSAGHQVAIAALCLDQDQAFPSLARLSARGVAVHRVVITPRGYRAERRALLALYGEVRPDVVHTHGVRTDVIDGLAAVKLGVPAVTTLHGRTGGGLRWRVFEWLQYGAIRRFHAVVAVSRPLVDYLASRRVSGDQVHLIPNAWTPTDTPLSREEARRTLGIRDDAPLIAWVGRLSPEKGADVFVEALAALRGVRAQVSVIGDGPDAALLRARVDELRVELPVCWHGIVPDAGRLFAAFDLFVLSSRTEGTPIALFEAMAAGVPIVASEVGGVPDVISNEEGVLVPSENPAALASAIRSVLANPSDARRRAERARERLESRFAPEAWLRRYETIYRKISGKR